MVSDTAAYNDKRVKDVLILVLMEYGLWRPTGLGSRRTCLRLNPCSNGIWSLTSTSMTVTRPASVLILVLMEYGLWLPSPLLPKCSISLVLILVLMEYGLWHSGMWWIQSMQRLNPCSNGIWSLTLRTFQESISHLCLNPCSNGIWSLTPLSSVQGCRKSVLILVLMEYGLWRSAESTSEQFVGLS